VYLFFCCFFMLILHQSELASQKPARCLVQLAAETQADMIVLALPTDRPDELLEIADEVRALSPCEVMVATQPSGRAVHATAASVS
jgi:hypothetical protein